MTHTLRRTTRRVLVALTALATALPVAAIASPAVADTRPADPALPLTVAADGLPTVQIDGVVWSQAVVGTTVYAGGEFTTARPAGSAAGVNTVPRHNLLAYDITTGDLVDSFDHDLNGQVLSVAASPDGSRIYVTGDFTQVDGQWRVRVAAFDTATGALLPSFAPTLGTRGLVVTATSSAVYVGGNFTSVASTTGGTLVARQYLAAFDPTSGDVLPFQADASAAVTALAVTSDGSKLVVGGRFTTLSGVNAYGLGGVDPATGASAGFAAASEVRNAGTASSITSLYADATGVYGTGYVYGSGGNLEGTFRADPATGQLVWVADCHGDTYSVFPAADVVYTVGHQHYCGNIPGGLPQSTPWTYHHISAFTKAATTTNTPDIYGYADHPGKPAPSTLYLWPQFYTGTYTGQGQAGWSVAGNDSYVVMGGEFVGLNGKAQQGLVRFATRDIAPNKQGPRLSGTDFPVKAVSDAPGEVRVTWTGNYDRDNSTLTYRVYRGTADSEPLTTRTVTAVPWDEPTLGFTDTGRPAGVTEQYLVTATDPYGNTASSAWVPVTVAGAGITSAYETVVRGSEPYAWWRLGESSGTTLDDTAGFDPAHTSSGVSLGTTGAISGDPDKAATFRGSSSGVAADTVPVNAPDQFSVEAWFSTTSSRGGKIVGFGSSQSGTSSTADRHLYLDNSGHVLFGVQDTGLKTVQSSARLNNGRWHNVVGTYTEGVMRLYVDGTEVATRSDVTYERSYWGYWRIGGDRLQGWPSSPSSIYLNGKIDDVAVYRRALSAGEVAAHRTAGVTGALPTDLAPTASILSTSDGATVSLDGASSTDRDGQVVGWAWDFGDGTTGTGAQVSHRYAETGTHTVTLTVTDDRGATGTTTAQVAVVVPANELPVATASAMVSGLVATFSGAASLDPDGTIAAYAWDFGDGTTGTGATPQHTYPAAGTYTATLIVTDDRGGTATTTVAVGVSAQLAADAFGRSTTPGWGSADVGGAWTVSNPQSASTVAAGVGRTSVAAGVTRTARLTSVSSSDTDARVTFTLDRDQTGGGTMVMLSPRNLGSTEYAARVKVVANGTASLQILAAGTSLASANLPGTYPAGTPITVRVQAVGTSPTTLRAKAWTGSTEPGWLASATDNLAALQVPGAVGLTAYVSGSATNGPVVASFDDLVAYPSGLVPPPNQAPTANFMAHASDLLVDFDARASSDPEGQPLTYAWTFGDGAVGTGVAPSHTYATAGTYTVGLTVTDVQGAAATVSRALVVTPPNQAPTASATSTTIALTTAFDGTTSADADGTLASWRWDFGDGETTTGSTASHTYAAAGTYTVTLTVTDDKGATGTTTLTVVAAAPVAVLAQDSFTRSLASGWGTADVGGAWTVDGAASTYQVDGATATQRLTSAGLTRTAMLKGVSSTATDLTATLSVDKPATGGGVYAVLIGRRVGTSDDALRVKFLASGSVQLQLLAGSTTLTTATMPGTYTPGDLLSARLQVVGTSPTTLRARVWRTADPEPTTWQLQSTDTAAAMQAAGSVGLLTYLSGSATNAPVAVAFDNLLVTQVP